jgi:hypothetical protein
MTDKLFQALDRMPQTARMRRGHAALLGDGQGNLYVFNPDGSRSSGMVWARVDGMGICSVRCRKISQQRDLPVIVDYGIDQVLEVVEENGAEAIAFTGDRGRSVGPHRDTHDILGPDPDFIQGLRFLPLLCHPTNPPSLSIYVRPYSYEYNGTRKTWAGGGLDLTSEIPTSSNEQLLIVVCLDPVTNVLSYYTGSNTTPFIPGDSVSFTASEIDVINTGSDWQIAAIRAYAGQTQFLWSDWMADRRGWIGGGGSGVTDHGELTGLADDDHTQYHNNARGDARYIQASLFDANTILAADSDNIPTARTIAEARFVGRKTGGTIGPLTGTEATVLLDNVIGDGGAGGTKGLVPAPAAGDAAAGKYLKADGTWVAPASGSSVAAYEDGVSVVAASDKFDFKDANVEDAGGNDAAIYLNLSHIFQARLTLESGVAVSTTDQIAKTVIYLTPCNGNKISLYDGTRQKLYTLSEISIKLTDAQTGTTHNGTKVIDGLTDTSQMVPGMEITGTGVGAASVIATIDSATQITGTVNSTASGTVTVTFKDPANTAYDIFCFPNSGTPKLEKAKWTSLTARATALTLQDGIDAKNGATTRRYIGSYCTTGTAGQCEMILSSPSSILLWNNYNRVDYDVAVTEQTNSWTYGTDAWRSANNNDANRIKIFVGIVRESLVLSVMHSASNNNNYYYTLPGIAEDANNTNNCADAGIGICALMVFLAGEAGGSTAMFKKKPAIGFHYYQWTERSAGGTSTIYSKSTTLRQSGILGTWKA